MEYEDLRRVVVVRSDTYVERVTYTESYKDRTHRRRRWCLRNSRFWCGVDVACRDPCWDLIKLSRVNRLYSCTGRRVEVQNRVIQNIR